ncbi:MAG: TonB-dependent receptor [Flavobacteriaceae bacterium]|nr:TonB-dependent receptor [Flavobacteriaceae bacterium]
MKTRFRLLLFFLMVFSISSAQEIVVRGTVTSSEDNMPIPGANVVVKGTTRGTSTDFDGNYEIHVNSGETLEFSSIGFKTIEIAVSGQNQINVKLDTDVSQLDEVVLIGYGTQKKADLTGSITAVDAEEIQKTPTSNVNQALQGKVAGVQVTSSGAPGVSANIKLRGVGTYTANASPLYIVDGMYYTDIDFLNTSDIKSLNVLKDASSTAIFGVKASGGVIIIETKSGGYDKKPMVTYEGYSGLQVAQNVLKMANAEQFVTMAYESGSQPDIDHVLAAMQRYGRSRVNPNVPNVNTDWYDEILTEAFMQSHSVNFSGGSNNVSYAIGMNYFSQDGILDHTKNEYERINLRSKIDAKLSDRFIVGTNFVVSDATQYTAEGGVWNQAYFAVPIMPVYDPQNVDASPIPYANAMDLGYRGTQNPFPTLSYNNNRMKHRNILANIYAEYDVLPSKLKFKTAYNLSYRPTEERLVNLPYTLGPTVDVPSSITIVNRVGKSRTEPGFNQIWDNTLTYTNSFGKHNITALAGTSFRSEVYNIATASGSNITGVNNQDNWNINNTDESTRNATSYSSKVNAVSYFGRLQYNFADKYLINATMRAEGTSKYTKNRWGYFPSVGAGWVVSEESFMKDNGVFDFLKLRASWGKNGNDKVAPSSGSNTVSEISTAIGGVQYSGTTVSSTYSDLEWEYVEESNFGISARLLDSRLTLEADYYIRDTKNAVIPVYQPIISLFVNQNAGIIRNQGFELALGWNNRISEKLSYNVSANFTTLKNEVTDIYVQDYIDGGSAEFRQRTMVGEPIRAFFGYEVAGVYQNQSDIDNDPAAVAEGNLVPGDFRYVDQNGDGVINDDDRVVLGSYLPKFTYGGNIGINYGDFEFSLSIYGQTGNKILNRKRGEVIWTPDQNMDADLAINRWHGEGTTNSYPSSAGLRKGWNQKMSDFYVEDGDFFRIQNIQLAYNLRGKKLAGANMPDTKIIFTAERPFTSFKYNGFNPEVNDGIDTQTYPVPAIYTLGLNIKI